MGGGMKNVVYTSERVDVVRCGECVHRPEFAPGGSENAEDLVFPDDVCPCKVEDFWYSWKPRADWFCANGERGGDNGENA